MFLAYENHLHDLLAEHGKKMEIWGWWPQAGGGGSVTVDKDIRIQAWLGDEQTFIDQGYDVVVSNESSRLYVVPKAMPGTANGTYIPDDDALYRTYAPSSSAHVQGLEMAQWGDRQYTAPEAYSLSYLRRPLQILASTAWGSPRMANYLDYEAMADTVGTAPGVMENADPDARPVTATAYGPEGAANAADGDPATAFAATTPGAAVGLDLGEGARRGPPPYACCPAAPRRPTCPRWSAHGSRGAPKDRTRGARRWPRCGGLRPGTGRRCRWTPRGRTDGCVWWAPRRPSRSWPSSRYSRPPATCRSW